MEERGQLEHGGGLMRKRTQSIVEKEYQRGRRVADDI